MTITTTASSKKRLPKTLALTAASLISVAGLSLAFTTPAQAATPTCHGLTATIVGTERADDLEGTAGRDVIVGLGGNDEIDGNGGDDVICGNAGADEIDGGRGNDWLSGGAGNDQLDGDRGQDRLYGRSGHDLLEGGTGRDHLNGGTSSDVKFQREATDRAEDAWENRFGTND